MGIGCQLKGGKDQHNEKNLLNIYMFADSVICMRTNWLTSTTKYAKGCTCCIVDAGSTDSIKGSQRNR